MKKKERKKSSRRQREERSVLDESGVLLAEVRACTPVTRVSRDEDYDEDYDDDEDDDVR